MHLPCRRYDRPDCHALAVSTERSALLLVDCNTARDEERRRVITSQITPVLTAAREVGVRVAYVHSSGIGTGGPADVVRSLLPPEGRCNSGPEHLRPVLPEYDPNIRPLADEPELPKCRLDAFDGTHLDYYLRSWGIDTVFVAGFRLVGCVYQTCLGARLRNYRLVLLRDCTCPVGTPEFEDTLASENPEGGWMRFVTLRMIETLAGWTSTGEQFICACGSD